MMNGRRFADRVRAFSALYPIPIIFSAMLAFALGCFGLAAVFVDPFGFVLTLIGFVTAFSAMALVSYVVVHKSDLLRVERETITMRWVDGG